MFPATDRWPIRGVAVAVVMLMVFLIIAITTASGLLTQQNYTTGSYREKTLHAELATKAGISTAMAHLTMNPLWAPTQAAPHREFLDPNSDVGFEVWLDTNNEQGAGPVPASNGEDLQVGQVAIQVRALINGKILTSGFGAAEQLIIMERPPVEFDNALFKISQGVFDVNGFGMYVLSYNSDSGIMPFTGLPAIPPPANQNASLRSLDDLKLGATLYGDVRLPTPSLLALSGGSYLSESRLDENYLPRIFEDKGDLNGDILVPGIIPPGEYCGADIPSGSTVSLVRGGTYYFSNIFQLRDNVTLDLSGPVTDGPVKLFCHTMLVGKNARINLPAPGLAPVPGELQFYGISQPGCDSILVHYGDNSETAMVVSGQGVGLRFDDNNKFYGAINARDFQFGDNLELHFDEALRGQDFDVRTEWVLVSHGIR